MLNALRRGSKGILAKLLIALLVFAFAIWGISDFVNQVDPTEVARAGDTPVTTNEFARLYERERNRLAQQMGTGLTPEQAQAIGLPQQVLQSLVTQALQVDAARALGLDVGDEELARRIRSQPIFAGSDGTFDRDRFDFIIGQNRYTEDEFLAIERRAAVQELWVNGLLGGYNAPEPYLAAVNRYLNQEREIASFALTEDALGPIPDPSQETLRAFYEENSEEFRAPERRAVAFVTLSAEALADPATVSAEAVRREYERAGAYGEPERRRVQQIVFDDPVLARRAAEAINEGTSFSVILAEMDKTIEDVDLGLVEREDIVDPAVREAAFSLEAGKAEAVEGRFGDVLVRVGEIREADKPPFEAIEDEIRRELAVDEAADLVNDIYNDVEDAVAGGAPVQEIAERFDLPLRVVEPVSRNGIAASGEAVEDLPDAVLRSAFTLAPGDDADRIESGDEILWVETREVIEAADRPFEEVEGEVLLAWVEAEKADRLADRAAEALDAVEAGTPVEDVAQRFGAEARTSGPFSRAEPPQDVSSAVVTAAFEGPQGHAGSVIAEPGRHVVFKVTSVMEPVLIETSPELQPVRRNLDDQLANTLLFEFVTAWQDEVGATQNPPIINQIVGLEQRTR